MKLALLTIVTMIAFAANSLLNRWALEFGFAGVWSFAAIRVMSGAVVLWLLVMARGGRLRLGGSLYPPATLAIYIFGFSFAYTVLDAGVGALILFGCVQLTMFMALVIKGQTVPILKWLGSAISLAGLAWLMIPDGQVEISFAGVASMGAAGVGWGLYSLNGARSEDPLANTARNFVWVVPLAVLFWALIPQDVTWQGYALGFVSGAITSGLGYALWYSVLPKLKVTTAALSQLTVPVIAALMGAVVLSEGLSERFIISAVLVIGGVVIGLRSTAK